MNRYASFHLGDRWYGIELARVREIARTLGITPVPGAREHVRGLLNLRGQIVTILDPGVRLGLPRSGDGAASHMVILKTRLDLAVPAGEAPEGPTGLLVDRVDDVVEADPAAIEPPSANLGEAQARFLAGVVRTPGGLLAILDLRELLFGT